MHDYHVIMLHLSNDSILWSRIMRIIDKLIFYLEVSFALFISE